MSADLTNGRTVFIVDDHAMVLRTIGVVVEAVPGLKVVGTATSGEDALDQLVHQPAPDVLLIDVNLPGLSGPETARRYRSLGGVDDRDQLVVLMSTSLLEDLPQDVLTGGADRFLNKSNLTVDSLTDLVVDRAAATLCRSD